MDSNGVSTNLQGATHEPTIRIPIHAGPSRLSVTAGFAADATPRSKRGRGGTETTSLRNKGLNPLSWRPQPLGATSISYGEKDIVLLKTKLRYTTIIVLPAGERILDFTCGDKEFWVVNGNENLAYVKPAKAGAENEPESRHGKRQHIFIRAAGGVGAIQRPARPQGPFVELREGGDEPRTFKCSAFVAASEIQAYQQQLEHAKEEDAAGEGVVARGDQGRHQLVHHEYALPLPFEAGKRPFNVRAMYHDDKFTYIQARPEEAPALYEVLDSKPSLVNFDYENGVYVARKVLHRGYLAIGKQKLAFTSEE